MNKLEKVLFDFLKKHSECTKPVLLALSGGPDSLALFHLLIKYRNAHALSFAVAHINHNWRSESSAEAETLASLASRHEVPFHLKTLEPACLEGNLEDACRNERYQFFQELCQAHGYQAVLLGHHADDQAETMLKRLLEGASCLRCNGMKADGVMNGISIWRPFLVVTKQAILKWLEEEHIVPFKDPTNEDSRFLRGRMRTSIVPYLNREFGKEVSANLSYLALEYQQMNEFLRSHLASFLESVYEDPQGSCLDLSVRCPSSAFELKCLLRLWLEKEDACFSRAQIDTGVELIQKSVANKKLLSHGAELYVDRRKLFLTRALDTCS